MSPKTTPIFNPSPISNIDQDAEFAEDINTPDESAIVQAENTTELTHPSELEDSEPQPESPSPSRRKWLWSLLVLAGLGGIGWVVYTQVIMPMFSAQGPTFGPMPVTLTQPTTARVQDSGDYIATLDSRGAVTV